jgi:anthranilate synthase/aminodeoxychorismate synthase-like glutamine amidotransferase
MVLVIDNYDSFTYNLVQYLGELGAQVVVRRNNRTTVDEIAAMAPDRILISPGPGRPEDAGVTLDVIRTLGDRVPILGVCLGHQAIGMAFGGLVVRGRRPMHGKTSRIEHDASGVLRGVSSPFTACRYHSLVVSDEHWPADLAVTARAADDGAVMALRHRDRPIHGVQFHPESILTEWGRQILRNFMALETGRR